MSSRSLWLPSFKKSDTFHSNNLKNSNSLNDIFQLEIRKDSQIYEFDSIEQYIEIELKYDKNYSSGLKIQPTINDIIVENSFMLSVINLDVLSETNIPTIFTTVIDKNSFLKKFDN